MHHNQTHLFLSSLKRKENLSLKKKVKIRLTLRMEIGMYLVANPKNNLGFGINLFDSEADDKVITDSLPKQTQPSPVVQPILQVVVTSH